MQVTETLNSGLKREIKVTVPASDLEAWAAEVAVRPFEEVGLILFGERRVTPCPFCCADGVAPTRYPVFRS